MIDIRTIPTTELEKDLQDSKYDILLCEQALLTGVTEYSGGSVAKRLDDNKHFVEVITGELARRLGVEMDNILPMDYYA